MWHGFFRAAKNPNTKSSKEKGEEIRKWGEILKEGDPPSRVRTSSLTCRIKKKRDGCIFESTKKGQEKKKNGRSK